MIKKIIKIFLFLFITCICTCICLFLAFIFIFHSDRMGKKISFYLEKAAKKNNIEMRIEKFKTNFPFYFSAKKIKFSLQNKNIELNQIKFKISLLSLLAQKISFLDFYIEDVKYTTKSKKEISIESKKEKLAILQTLPPYFPFDLYIDNFYIKNINITPNQNFFCSGKIIIKKDFKNFNIDLEIGKFLDKNKEFLKINAKKEKEFLITKIILNTKNIKKLFTEIDENISANIKLFSKNKIQLVKDFFLKKEKINLSAKVSGEIGLNKFSLFQKNKIFSNLKITNDLSFNFYNLKLKNNFLNLFAKGDILQENNKFLLKNLDLQFKTKNLSILYKDLKGFLNGNILFKENKITSNINSKNIKYKKADFSDLNINISAYLNNSKIQGEINADYIFASEKFLVSSKLFYENNTFNFSNINITSPSSKIYGNIKFNKKDLFQGMLFSNFQNLNLLKTLFPNINVKGEISNKITFLKKDILLQSSFNNIIFQDFLVENGIFNLSIQNIFSKRKYFLNTNLNNLRFEKSHVDNLKFKILENKNFEIKILENKKKIETFGHFEKNSSLDIFIKRFNLLLEKETFYLARPSKISFQKDLFSIDNFEIKNKNGFLKIDILLEEKNPILNISSKNFPVNFIPFLPIISGKITSKIHVEKEIGSIDLNMQNFSLFISSEENPLSFNGKLLANLKNEKLKISTSLDTKKEKILNFNATVPIKINFIPFNIKIKNEDISADIDIKGKIQDLLEFIDLEEQNVYGDIEAKISIKNKFLNPEINGFCNIKNAKYENYLLGTFLNFKADLTFDNKKIILKLYGKDEKNGTFIANGTFDIFKNYDYKISFDLFELLLLNTKYVKNSLFTGNLILNGNKTKAMMKGEIEVSETDFFIPDQITQTLPSLNIKFINKPKKQKIVSKKKYPLYLEDIILKTKKDDIFVRGRGVNANLKGKVKINGTYSNPIFTGKLDVTKGKYLFSGRDFNLVKSSLTFLGEKSKMPYLFLEGQMRQKAIVIIAHLKGPLNDPQLSFSSSPSLPINSIISYLLFGEDISDISAIQALQVATTIATFTQGPGILESTKRSLGIDRLAIVSMKKQDIDDPDKIGVQIGKYVSKGILLTFTQGTEDGTTNAGVEVDLGKGFSFELETLKEEEQTRGALKWGKSF